MDCKQQFNYNNQAGSKRQRFRLEIRRKNIESYQKKVRSLHIQAEKEKNQTIGFAYQQTLLNHQQKEETEQHQFAYQKKTEENESQIGQMLATYELQQTLNRLEEISLTDANKLCKVSLLDELVNLLQDLPVNATRFLDKIQQIIMKLCINEPYWSEQFLFKLLHFLLEVEKLEINIQEYLVSLSKCSLAQFKAILYRLMLTLNIFSHSSTKTTFSCAIKVLYNFILAPPFIMHSNQNLYSSRQQLTQSWYVEKILSILALAISPSKHAYARSILPRIDIQERNKQFLTVLEIVYGLMNRVNGIQNSLVIVCMQNLEWKIMREALHRYHQSQTMNESNLQLKAKFRILQIALSILSFQDRQQGVSLNFLYAFLNPLMSIIVSDFQLYMSKWQAEQDVDTKETLLGKQNEKKNRKYEPNELKKKYESLLLQVLSGLLSVQDQLGSIPALKFIKQRYPNFFQNLYAVYEKHFIIDKKKINYMCLITEILLANLSNSGEISSMATFLEDLILERYSPNREILEDLLQDLLVFVRNWKQNNSPCILLAALKQNKILQALEKMGDESHSASVYEELLETLDNCQI